MNQASAQSTNHGTAEPHIFQGVESICHTSNQLCLRMARKPKISPEEQRRRFEEAAREAGVDERPETLERIVRKIAETPNPTQKQKGQRQRRGK
jgi:hypothetical protein